jgi:hypothetical protein
LTTTARPLLNFGIEWLSNESGPAPSPGASS